jgi:hypothetical protein
MPTKKDLAALLSENPQPPLRRGRGLRLSRVSKHALNASFEMGAPPAAPDQAAARPAERPPAADALAEPTVVPLAAASEPASVTADPRPLAAPDVEPGKPSRKKRKLLLRNDLLKECKRIARSQDRKLYQVIESALEDYIKRHGVRE